jgi:hypothetical protein
MLGQLDMWALNIWFLLGLLLALGAGAIVLAVVWMLLRAWLWRTRKRRAWKSHVARTRRADGRPYPPMLGGTCAQCGHVGKGIYHPVGGPSHCPDCYERHWRQKEAPGADGSAH